MAETEECPSWLGDYILGILKSPTWTLPIAEFKDQHCEMWEDVEEFTFDHSKCHNEFRNLVISLFEAHLLEVMITPEQFDHFCESGLEQNERVHRALVEVLLAVDDFLSFKAMMARHAADLTAEVVAFDMDKEGADPNVASIAQDLVASTVAQGVGADGDWNDREEEEAIQLALALEASKLDEEGMEAQLKCEEAALEQAIALSLQVEEERVRQSVEDDQAEAAGSGAAAPPAPAAGESGQKDAKFIEIAPKKAPQARAELPPCQDPAAKAAKQAAEMEDVRNLRARAEQTVMAPKSVESMQQRKAAVQAALAAANAGKQGPTAEERAARADHLKRQRDVLKQKRAHERNRQIDDFSQKKAAQAAASGIDSQAKELADRMAAGRRLIAELTPGAALAPAPNAPGTSTEAAEKMRQALTAQIRSSLARSWSGGVGDVDAKVHELAGKKA
mmetsp:Transcript_23476/g.51500  ORF Transcript_23476/g.51500 Transcript_23476/m.51500 type:complete len:448 (-) Transcript_23476:241-1584(-)|eukprot:CAMPEP_0206471710 /NCGR_PEP_ID=MMETSP0324_2-20121206/31738_1 /ASSEMBLY_ACC=CAM_ASM_000836 /TAXON_ID=2866 /ORGANISM="Crypthecodinium cohnii, Strain Seligo" /LENGTH=447 /DNA_ID=CAMNT_0053946113 /DNA_START=60 /DNA_END=1403 /DNA_ORIENTATION=-